MCDSLVLFSVGERGLCCLQVFFASAFVWFDAGHHSKHCCGHTRSVSVVCITCNGARFATVTCAELAHGSSCNPLHVVLVAVALHGHEVVFVNGGFDPEIGFVAEFFEEVAHVVWLAALAGVILACLVVGIIPGVEVVKTLCEFGICKSQNVRGVALRLTVHHVVAAVEPTTAHVFAVVAILCKAGRIIRAVQDPVRALARTLGAKESCGHPSRFDKIVCA